MTKADKEKAIQKCEWEVNYYRQRMRNLAISTRQRAIAKRDYETYSALLEKMKRACEE